MPDIRHIRIAPNTTVDIKDDTKIPNTSIGAAGGVAQLDANGKVPSSQLPSYVDDVLEYADLESFPLTGEAGKIYVALNNNRTYRWSGTTYVEISESLALGETSSTAYRGDRGKTAYDHASAKGSAFTAGMYKITTNSEGHVTAATAVAKSDITGLGIPGQDTTYSAATQSAAGLMSAADKTKLDGVATGATANVGTITGIKMNGASKGTSGVVDLGTVITAHQSISGKADKVSSATAGDVATLDANGNLVDSGKTLGKSVPSDAKFTDTTYSDMTGATSSAAGAHGLVPAPTSADRLKYLRGDGTWAEGSTVDISGKADKVSSATAGDVATLDANGNLVDSGKTLGKSVPSDAKFTDTTYSAATQSAAGLMSAADKTKLDGVATGATANVGTITGIKMNGASKGTSGVVDLGTVITAHQDISGKVTGPASATNNAVAIFDGTGGKTIKNSGFTIGKSVPSDAKFTDTTYSQISRGSSAGLAPGLPSGSGTTKYLREDGSWQVPPDTNTWRGIQDNLTSTSTTDSLSAAQGKLLNDYFNLDMMEDEIRKIENVSDAKVIINRTSETVDGIPAHTIAAYVYNGNAGYIAQKIYDYNTIGYATTGSVSRTVSSGDTVRFSRPTDGFCIVHVVLEGVTAPSIDSVSTAIKNVVMTYINGLRIGETLNTIDLKDIVLDAAESLSIGTFNIQDINITTTSEIEKRGIITGTSITKWIVNDVSKVSVSAVQSAAGSAISTLNSKVANWSNETGPNVHTIANGKETNLNNIIESGIYSIEDASNGPNSGTNNYGCLHVIKYSDTNYITQIWQSVVEDKIYIRKKLSGTWSSWEQLALNSNLHNIAEYDATVTWLKNNNVVRVVNENGSAYRPIEASEVTAKTSGGDITLSGLNNNITALSETNNLLDFKNDTGDHPHTSATGRTLDLNAIVETGAYSIEGASNGPNSGTSNYGCLSVIKYSDTNYVTQIWQSVVEDKIYIRKKLSGTWSAWNELALNSKVVKTTTIEYTAVAPYIDIFLDSMAGKSVISIHIYPKNDGDNQYWLPLWSVKKSTGQIAITTYDALGSRVDMTGKTFTIVVYYVDSP